MVIIRAIPFVLKDASESAFWIDATYPMWPQGNLSVLVFEGLLSQKMAPTRLTGPYTVFLYLSLYVWEVL